MAFFAIIYYKFQNSGLTCPDRPLSPAPTRAQRRSPFRSSFRSRSRLAHCLFKSPPLRDAPKIKDYKCSLLFWMLPGWDSNPRPID